LVCVAEKSNDCLVCGKFSTIAFKVFSNPMSKSLSASSSTGTGSMEVLHHKNHGKIQPTASRNFLTKDLKVVGVKQGSLIHVLQQPPWCANEDIHRRKALLLALQVLSSNDQPCRKGVLCACLSQHLKDLHCLDHTISHEVHIG